MVLVPKKVGSLRVCGDYKMTVNRCADVDLLLLHLELSQLVSVSIPS